MTNKMLIDASHPEETRVVVIKSNRIEEYDFESEHKKQLKGNIYLARVMRVEPSLQAAFVEYGSGRHGFLAFSEIHPDYYQIPTADRLALLEAEEAALNENEEKNEVEIASSANAHRTSADSESLSDETNNDNDVESVGEEDAIDEARSKLYVQRRPYKIQEVIKRRQVLLVQVIKEERGNKGAALTTYLSLAGRYSVLMPNTARGGGISRKITNIQDRNRLKEIVKNLEVPKGMGVILRTAGANRTKGEIKRDYEYLIRLWENVRELTLESRAPALVHEEGSLIKRSIRDLYHKGIEEILVSGETGYREAKDFIRMLMPSHAKVVQPYRGQLPILAQNGIEIQLDKLLQAQVSLKSGGYLVINQTEALVAIDVNSGRSTKENSIEETAYQTNLEAAEEIARQLRLRDLAGLVVIDFIDMAEKKNIRSVEKKLKECLKGDRARIQVGQISHFGLLEMSRQRIRASVLESTMQPCPHCDGSGHIRSESSVALHVMRSIEEYLLRNNNFNIHVRTPVKTALYVLNHKRQLLAELEDRFGLSISIEADENLGAQHLVIEKGTISKARPASLKPQIPEAEEQENDKKTEIKIAAVNKKELEAEEDTNVKQHKHRRRGRRGGRRNRENQARMIPPSEPVGPFTEESDFKVYSSKIKKEASREDLGEKKAEAQAENKSEKRGHSGNRSKGGRNLSAKSAEFSPELVGPISNTFDNILDNSVTEPTGARYKKEKTSKTNFRHRNKKHTTEKENSSPVEENGSSKADAVLDHAPEKKGSKSKKTTQKKAKNSSSATANASKEHKALATHKEASAENKDKTAETVDSIATEDNVKKDEKPKKRGWWERRNLFKKKTF